MFDLSPAFVPILLRPFGTLATAFLANAIVGISLWHSRSRCGHRLGRVVASGLSGFPACLGVLTVVGSSGFLIPRAEQLPLALSLEVDDPGLDDSPLLPDVWGPVTVSARLLCYATFFVWSLTALGAPRIGVSGGVS